MKQSKNKHIAKKKNLLPTPSWFLILVVFFSGIAIGYGVRNGESSTKNSSKAESPTTFRLEALSVNQSNPTAITMSQACKNGIPAACFNWGFLKKESGRIKEAKFLYKYACNKGHALSCNSLRVLK